MKILLHLVAISMLATNSVFASTLEDTMEAELKNDRRRILVRNNNKETVEVNRSQYGAIIFCFENGGSKFYVYEVDEDMLKRQFTAVVSCQNGDLYFRPISLP